MPMPLDCEARQMSDQMRCERCDLTWDMNDPDAPHCKQDVLVEEVKCKECGYLHPTFQLLWDSSYGYVYIISCARCGEFTTLKIREPNYEYQHQKQCMDAWREFNSDTPEGWTP